MIFGLDEVGLGALAGPLVVCGFVASEEWDYKGLNDSKKLTRLKREKLFSKLDDCCGDAYCLSWQSAEDIDKYGVWEVWRRACNYILESLVEEFGIPDRVIVDGNKSPFHGAECYPKADSKFPVVMAASVMAKVRRDRFVSAFETIYPGYGWDEHVGYGTATHLEAIQRLGVCAVHRRSYRPISTMLSKNLADDGQRL